MIVSAGAIIEKEGVFLVIFDRHGNWGFPKGHVDEGETVEAAAKREVKEEVGLDIELTEKKGVVHYDVNGEPKQTIYFLATWKAGEAQCLEEVEEVRWGTKEEVLNLLTFEEVKECFLEVV